MPASEAGILPLNQTPIVIAGLIWHPDIDPIVYAMATTDRPKAKAIVNTAATEAVSYTHLDVYKRQKENNRKVVYTIIGYADKGTGSKTRNERLSKARAEAVYDCLVKEFGVPEATLNVAYEGGVDNMFYDDPRLSRAVITEAK